MPPNNEPFHGWLRTFASFPDADFDISNKPFRTRRPEKLRLICYSATIAFLVMSLIWVLLLYLRDMPGLIASATSQTFHAKNAAYYGKFVGTSELLVCGNTTTDAKQRGCQYDVLSNHWVHSLCWDQYSVEEYQADGSWFGFADEERNQILTIKEMSEMDFYYTNLRDHIVHCAMLWKKQFRAFAEERPNLDTVIADEEHTMHCAQFLIDMSENGPDYRDIPIKVFVGYAGCWAKEAI